MFRPQVGRVTWALPIALAVAACSCSKSEPRLSFDRASVRFVGLQGVPMRIERLNVSATGSGSYYPAIRTSPPGAWWYTWSATGSTAWIDVHPMMATSPDTMPAGTLRGSITFLACDDAACASVASSATAALEADVAVVPRAAVSLAAYEQLTGAPVELAVSPPDAGGTVVVSADAAGGSVDPLGWLTIDRSDPAVIRASGSGDGLAPGTYSGELHVTRTGVTGQLDIPVALTVGSATIPPAATTVVLDHASQPSALSGSLPVRFQPGVAPSWTVTADAPWLQVFAPGASGDGSIGYALDPAALTGLPNWTPSVATLTIRPEGLAPVSATFTVHKQLPEITFAATPLVADRPSDVRLFGRGLAQLAVSDLAVDGVTGLAGFVDSDREALLTGLSLPAGRHVVSVANAVGVGSGIAPLDAFVVPSFPAGAVDHAGAVRSVAFDVGRARILVAKTGTLARLTLVEGAWQLDETAVPDLAHVALAPDGDTLYAATAVGLEHGTLHLVDPSTLAIRASYTTSGAIGPIATVPPAFTADGRVWLAGGEISWFDPVTHAFFRHEQADGTYLRFEGARLAASGDAFSLLASAQTVVGSTWADGSGSPWVYTPGTGNFTHAASAPKYFSSFVVSRDGARALSYDHGVYDTRTWVLLGLARVDAGVAGGASALSPDGRRVYRAIHSAAGDVTNGALVRIDVLDADAVVPGTTRLVKLGEIPVSAMVSTCGPHPSAATDCAAATRLAVSPFGETLLVGGTVQLRVVPVPAALSGLAPR